MQANVFLDIDQLIREFQKTSLRLEFVGNMDLFDHFEVDILDAVVDGETTRVVAGRFGIAVSSVIKGHQRYRATGTRASPAGQQTILQPFFRFEIRREHFSILYLQQALTDPCLQVLLSRKQHSGY